MKSVDYNMLAIVLYYVCLVFNQKTGDIKKWERVGETYKFNNKIFWSVCIVSTNSEKKKKNFIHRLLIDKKIDYPGEKWKLKFIS